MYPRIQTGPVGQKRVVIQLGPECYLDSHPHALKPDHIYMEYVRSGRCQSTFFMSEDDALALLVDTVKGVPAAGMFRIHRLRELPATYDKVSQIPVLSYPETWA